MARHRREIGTSGPVSLTPQVVGEGGRWVAAPSGTKAQRWRGRVKVRDHDGRMRDLERYGPTRGKAETAIRAAIRDRHTPHSGTTLSPTMTFGDAGKVWLTHVARPEQGLAASTLAQYSATWRRVFAGSPFTDFTLAEANRVPRIRAFLQGVADERGSGTASTARSVISSVLTLAVDDGLFDTNAARQVRTPRRSTTSVAELSTRDRELVAAGWSVQDIQPNRERAFTAAQRADLIAKTRADEESSGMAR